MYKEIIRDPEAQLFTAHGMKHQCMAHTLYEMKTQALLGLGLRLYTFITWCAKPLHALCCFWMLS